MVDRNFPRNPKEIESRLLQGGTPYSIPAESVSDNTDALQYEIRQKNALARAERAGVVTIIRPKSKPPAPKPPAEVYDVGSGMDMDSFIVKFDEHFEIAHGILLGSHVEISGIYVCRPSITAFSITDRSVQGSGY